MKTGIHCYIYRSDLGECSLSGISSKTNTVTLIDPAVNIGPFAATEDAPAVRLVRRTFNGEVYVHAEPVIEKTPCFMAGGTFIYSCDSRFHETVGHSYPVSLHDRVEN